MAQYIVRLPQQFIARITADRYEYGVGIGNIALKIRA